jgi:predicted ATPase
VVSFPPFRLDLEEERLWRGDTLLALRRKPFAILRYLATHPRRLVGHDELLAQVWNGAVVSESAVRTHLYELRQVLGEGIVETVIGRGYRFIAELANDAPPAAPAAPAAPRIRRREQPVVARDGDLTALRGALERTLAGHRQVCFVTGEPGIGKTTLVDAFLDELEDRGILAVRGHSFEQHGTPEAYLAMIEVLGQLRRSERGPQVLDCLVRHAPTFLVKVPHLVPDDQLTEVARRAQGGTEARMVRELAEAIEAACAQDPIAIVLEDLQWADVATIDLLALLGQRTDRAKLLVIATSRHAEIQSTEHPLNRVMRSLISRSRAAAVALARIDRAGVQQLLDLRFPGHAFPAQLADIVSRTTAGTPLFVVSLIDDLVGRGMIADRGGAPALAVSLDDIEAHRPDSIKQLIDIGLDRLTQPEQRVLEAASVVGTEFPTALVAAALELSDEQVDDTCDALARRGLFLSRLATQELADGTPTSRYAVTHALVH